MYLSGNLQGKTNYVMKNGAGAELFIYLLTYLPSNASVMTGDQELNLFWKAGEYFHKLGDSFIHVSGLFKMI